MLGLLRGKKVRFFGKTLSLFALTAVDHQCPFVVDGFGRSTLFTNIHDSLGIFGPVFERRAILKDSSCNITRLAGINGSNPVAVGKRSVGSKLSIAHEK